MMLQDRLIVEEQILQRVGLSQFQIFGSKYQGSYNLWGTHKTNSGRSYRIWTPIPNRYPHARPPVYVYKPNPLHGRTHGKTLNDFGVSHNMHTLANGPNGEVQICHWRDDRWHSAITLNKVMIKAVLWLEAYEQYLSSGYPITDFVRSMQ